MHSTPDDQTRSPSPLTSRASSSEEDPYQPNDNSVAEQKFLDRRRDELEQKCLGTFAALQPQHKFPPLRLPEVVVDDLPSPVVGGDDDVRFSTIRLSVELKSEDAPSPLSSESDASVEEGKKVASEDGADVVAVRRPWYRRWRWRVVILLVLTAVVIAAIVVGTGITHWTRPAPAPAMTVEYPGPALSSTALTLNTLGVIATAYRPLDSYSSLELVYLRDTDQPYASSGTLMTASQSTTRIAYAMHQSPIWTESIGDRLLLSYFYEYSVQESPAGTPARVIYTSCEARDCTVSNSATTGCENGKISCSALSLPSWVEIHRESPFAHLHLAGLYNDTAPASTATLFLVRARSVNETGTAPAGGIPSPYALVQFDHDRRSLGTSGHGSGKNATDLGRMPTSLLALQNVGNSSSDSYVLGSFESETSLDAYHIGNGSVFSLTTHGLPPSPLPPNATLARPTCTSSTVLILAVSSTQGGVIRQLKWGSKKGWPASSEFSSEDLSHLPPADAGRGSLSASCIDMGGERVYPFISYWSGKKMVYSRMVGGRWEVARALIPGS